MDDVQTDPTTLIKQIKDLELQVKMLDFMLRCVLGYAGEHLPERVEQDAVDLLGYDVDVHEIREVVGVVPFKEITVHPYNTSCYQDKEKQMKFEIVLKFEDSNGNVTDKETVFVEARSIDEARKIAPIHMKTKALGRTIRYFDKKGNEIFGGW